MLFIQGHRNRNKYPIMKNESETILHLSGIRLIILNYEFA